MLFPLLVNLVLNENLLDVLGHELSNECGVPKLAGDAEIFTTSPQCSRFAAFDSSGDAFRGEVVLFTSGDRYKSIQGFLSAKHRNGVDVPYLPSTTSAYSLVTAFAVTIVSPRGASPQPPGPNAWFNILLYFISGK